MSVTLYLDPDSASVSQQIQNHVLRQSGGTQLRVLRVVGGHGTSLEPGRLITTSVTKVVEHMRPPRYVESRLDNSRVVHIGDRQDEIDRARGSRYDLIIFFFYDGNVFDGLQRFLKDTRVDVVVGATPTSEVLGELVPLAHETYEQVVIVRHGQKSKVWMKHMASENKQIG